MIDRRVLILDGAGDRPASATASALRDDAFLVLLGEPGIGKSTVLEVEAQAAGVQSLKVRELINGTATTPAGTLFLDALDEYRMGATDLGKVDELVKAIQQSGATRWRLTCRAEDWKKAADIHAMQRATGGNPITVAQILPLDLSETLAVLAALGEPDPDAFVDRAYTMGAAGLLESPLSLKLLRQSVIGDRPWPSTRFALFDQATAALAHEDNVVHRLDRGRSSAEAIRDAAARISLYLLATGSRLIWRSGALPSSGDPRAYLRADALGIDPALVDDTLGSTLFRGEGEAFEPVHRTIAEYLGGLALARAVVGHAERRGLPLGRARALVTGGDGRAPTDLRGLYAWFAAHLAVLGACREARELVEADAVSALVYGDAAIFDTATKRIILANLDRHDPYFRASDVGVTAVGGLACEELADDLRRAIQTGDGSHRMMTVYEVLAAGQPVASLKPALRAILLDPARPEWQRTRAAAAWLNGQEDVGAARRELFDALHAEPISTAREALRVALIGAIPPERVSDADITSVIADFAVATDDNTIMRLDGLEEALVAHPRPTLFDTVFSWLPDDATRRHSIDVEHLVDRALAAAIRATPDLSGERLWRWLTHARDDRWTSLGDTSRPAVKEWLDARPGRDVELFAAVLATDVATEGPWVVGTNYLIAAGAPSDAILDDVIDRAQQAKGTARRRLLAIAVNLARRYEVDAAYWRLYALLESMPRGGKALFKTLTVAEVERWRRDQQTRNRNRNKADAKRRAKLTAQLRKLSSRMRRGARPAALSWGAEIYFFARDKKGESRTGIERLAAETDGDVVDAILAGWRYLASNEVTGVSPATLGEMEAKGNRFFSEWAALAGLDRLRDQAEPVDLMALPLTLAIVALRSGSIAHSSGAQKAIEAWAWRRLNLDPAAGADVLVAFWEAALTGGATNSSIWQRAGDDQGGEAARRATLTMLERHPTMPAPILRTLVAAAARRVEATQLLSLATSALGDLGLRFKQRAIWSLVAFALDPAAHRDCLDEVADASLFELFEGHFGEGLLNAFPKGTDAEQMLVAERVFRRLAPHAEPYVSRSGRVPQDHRLSDAANAMLKTLAASADPAATASLARLQEAHAAYPTWEAALRHAAAEQMRTRRDREFVPPTVAAVGKALAGKAPANAADLRAILVDELGRFARELRTAPNAPWKAFWNTDTYGKATEPRIENIDRDTVLTQLLPRLEKYQIALVLPEAQRRDDTRADILIAAGAGRNLPIEAKRHYHKELWTAAAGQLQGYASDPGADGFGILLVFWFGAWASTPPRGDKKVPASADELKALLESDLPANLRDRTDIVVLDVGDPGRTAPPKKPRAAKPAQAPAPGVKPKGRNARNAKSA
jgi:hypothetical protein